MRKERSRYNITDNLATFFLCFKAVGSSVSSNLLINKILRNSVSSARGEDFGTSVNVIYLDLQVCPRTVLVLCKPLTGLCWFPLIHHLHSFMLPLYLLLAEISNKTFPGQRGQQIKIGAIGIPSSNGQFSEQGSDNTEEVL